MITQSVHIKNFKSIKDLQFFPRKINLFIGEPNAGKSNIVEALSCLSGNTFESAESLKNSIRFEHLGNLFHDAEVTEGISVIIDEVSLLMKPIRNRIGVEIKDKGGNTYFELDPKGELATPYDPFNEFTVKPYSFKRMKEFELNYAPYLNPPFGNNLPQLLAGNSYLKGIVATFIKDNNFLFNENPFENEISISKQIGDSLITYPYQTISETFQRIIFMMMIIESNKNSLIVMDEPEANTFPYYTKYIAEQIALDDSNQYFISTHNPYLLSAIVEKAKVEDVAVFITFMDNLYQTQLKKIDDAEMGLVLDLSSDVFFNLDKFLHE